MADDAFMRPAAQAQALQDALYRRAQMEQKAAQAQWKPERDEDIDGEYEIVEEVPLIDSK